MTQCDYQGLISGSVTLYDRCSMFAAWAIQLPGCGHDEYYCTSHKEQFPTYGQKVSLVCSCGVETAGLDIAWRAL